MYTLDTERKGLLTAALVGVAVGSLMAGLYSVWYNRREQEEFERTRAQLERRARIVERLVPKRKPRLDRIVVHI